MSEDKRVLIKESTLTALADAVRAKTGTEADLLPSEMSVAVDGIEPAGAYKEALNGMIDGTITEIESQAESIGEYAFYKRPSLTTANFPVVTSIGSFAFGYCSSLTTVDFPAATSIGDYTFYNCTSLKALILRKSDAICTLLSSSAFTTSTPIASGTGYIYVPRSVIDSYKSTAPWSGVASQFRALEDYTVDGTITGALDESKI